MNTTKFSWLDILIAKARILREVGVAYIKVGSCEAKLTPPVEAPDAQGVEQDPENNDPLTDPATYGRLDGRVPGFPREELE